MWRRARPALGTLVEIAVAPPGHDEGRARRAVEAAFAAVARVERTMSFHDAASDLSTLNRDAARRSVRVDPWLHRLLGEAAFLFDATDGLFDCAIATPLVDAGLLPDHGHAEPMAPAGSFSDVRLGAGDTVRFARPLQLDLGGIAKGFAVDRAIDCLGDAGVTSAVVNAGGDLRVLGDDPVAIHVRLPAHARLRPDDLSLVDAGTLADGALATSSCFDAAAFDGRQARSALVDPRRRSIVVSRRTWSVIAPTCTVADALTKVAAIAEPDALATILAHFRATVLVDGAPLPASSRRDGTACAAFRSGGRATAAGLAATGTGTTPDRGNDSGSARRSPSPGIQAMPGPQISATAEERR